MSKISDEEKNIFLEDLESENDELFKEQEEQEQEQEYEEDDDEEYEEEEEEVIHKKKKKKKKKSYATAIFASIFVFFILIVILLIFLLSIADTGNPVFIAFGIEGYEIKSFLKGLTNNIFMVLIVFLLLATAIGIFRGYSLPKEEKKKRKASFVFGGVCGGLIFFSILSWGAVITFIDKFVTGDYQHAVIEFVDPPKNGIHAPIDLTFSAKEIAKELRFKNNIIKGYRWSKDGGMKFSPYSLNQEYTFRYFQDGAQTVKLEVELLSGEVKEFQRTFLVDSTTFLISPYRVLQSKPVEFDASNLFKGSATYFWDFDGDGIDDQETRSAIVKTRYDTKGEQTVNLKIVSSNDGIRNYTNTFHVYAETDKLLEASIIVEETTGKAPLKLTFDGGNSYSYEDTISQYLWKIEGKSQKGEIVDHIFEKEGTYTVSLTITTESGKKDTTEIDIIVTKGNSPPNTVLYTKPKMDSNSEKVVGYLPLTVNFYGGKSTDAEDNIVQYKWNLVDSEGENIQEFFGEKQEYIFRKAGMYTMTLGVSDAEGESTEKTVTLEIKEKPVTPVVSAFPESGTAPLVVEFNASLSTCRTKDCKIISYEWDYDDKTKIINAGAFTSHQFKEPGSYDVNVTAITNNGDRVDTTLYITVTEEPLVACFSSSRTEGVAPLTVAFDPEACSKGDIVKYHWDFGDGYIATKKKTVYTYASPGTYTATLQVFDKTGRVNTMKEVITVKSNSE